MNNSKDINEIGLRFFETKTEESFTRLYERIKPGLFVYAMKVMRDHDLANHIVNKTMAMVHQKIDLFNPSYKMSTWIYRIAYTNACFELRAINKNKPLYISEFDEDENKHLQKMQSSAAIRYAEEAETIEDYSSIEEIADEVSVLVDLDKELLHDKFYENMTFQQIADKRAIPIQDVKARIKEIKKHIKTNILSKRKL